MFRLWGKIFKENRMLKDMVVCNGDYSLSRTDMIFDAIEKLCYEFDLEQPIWLEATVSEFKRHDKVRFTEDNFIEGIDFDFLEIHVIEE